LREPGKEPRPTILLVDPDLGFVFWLGHALDTAGYNAVPAQDTRAASELIREHKLAVDILVIDPLLPDAIAFVTRLRRSRRSLNVVAAIPEEWEEIPPMPEVDAVIRKPRRFNSIAALPWIHLIQNLSSDVGSDVCKTKLP
jgi:CheY-like chemotaxis protein